MIPAMIPACCRLRRSRGPGYGPHPFYAPGGGLLPHGTAGWLLAAVIAYLIVHALAGHARHRLGRRRVSYGRSVLRGPWFPVRPPRP